jgi:hypothetical protein
VFEISLRTKRGHADNLFYIFYFNYLFQTVILCSFFKSARTISIFAHFLQRKENPNVHFSHHRWNVTRQQAPFHVGAAVQGWNCIMVAYIFRPIIWPVGSQPRACMHGRQPLLLKNTSTETSSTACVRGAAILTSYPCSWGRANHVSRSVATRKRIAYTLKNKYKYMIFDFF